MFKKITTLLLLFLLITLNLATELTNWLKIDSLILIKSFIITITFLLIKRTTNKYNKIAYSLTLIFSLLFILNIILNMINVYALECKINKEICSLFSNLFYKIKIFRFITLSSYFFTTAISLLLLISLNLKIKFSKFSLLQKTFFLILAAMLLSNLLKSIQIIYLSTIQSFQVRNENYYDRFTFKNGGVSYYGWIRVFSNFIISQTNRNSVILVPPQSDTYKMEGNIYYLRWFLYPRKLLHLEDLTQQKNGNIEYVIISAGECNDKKCNWPDYEINKDEIEEIILVNRENQKTEIIKEINYKPENFYQKWGLIKLK